MATDAQIAFIARGLVCISAARGLVDTLCKECNQKPGSPSQWKEMEAIHGAIISLSVSYSMCRDVGGLDSPLDPYSIVPDSDLGATTVFRYACIPLLRCCFQYAKPVDDPQSYLKCNPSAILLGDAVDVLQFMWGFHEQPASAIIHQSYPPSKFPEANTWHGIQWSSEMVIAAREAVKDTPERLPIYLRHELHRWTIDNLSPVERQEALDTANASIGRFKYGHALAFGPREKPIERDTREERDAWIYRQIMGGVTQKTLLSALANQCKIYSWDPIQTWQGCRDRANAYADRHGLTSPKPRSKPNRG